MFWGWDDLSVRETKKSADLLQEKISEIKHKVRIIYNFELTQQGIYTYILVIMGAS